MTRNTPAEIIAELAEALDLSQLRAEHLYEAAEIDERHAVLALPWVASANPAMRASETARLRTRAEHQRPDLSLAEAVAAYVDASLARQQAAARIINERDWSAGWMTDRSTPYGTPYTEWLAGRAGYRTAGEAREMSDAEAQIYTDLAAAPALPPSFRDALLRAVSRTNREVLTPA